MPELIIIVCLVLLIIILVSLRPEDFRVSRSININAGPDKIFPHVNNLHAWKAWDPWAKLDPNSKATYSGADSGLNAAMASAGNHQVGEGKMTITESRPVELIRLRLEFFKPMTATNLGEFTFQPDGKQTKVTWAMSGKNNFMMKAFGLFVNCDSMVGSQFEKGLASLKELVETPTK